MAKIELRVITHLEAATKGILEGPIGTLVSSGSDDFVCGRCGTSIAKSTSRESLSRLMNAAFKCNACNAVNAI